MGIYDVIATELIVRVAQELKKEPQIKAPVWAQFAKTGMSRERPPVQTDWWHIRAAAILRKLFVLGPIGTSKLSTKFSGRKNRGMAPDRVFPSARNHLRKILQQLEKAGFAKQVQKGAHKGRIATPKGQHLLETVANQLMKEQGIVLPAKPVEEMKIETPVEQKPKKPRAPRKPRAKKAEPETEPKEEPKEEPKVEVAPPAQ